MSAFGVVPVFKKPRRRPYERNLGELTYLLTATLMGCGGGSDSMAPPLVKGQTVQPAGVLTQIVGIWPTN